MPNYVHFPLPDVGEGLVEAEILTWHVQPGQEVQVNQIFVEIETSKAAVELPAPYAGVVKELLAEPGQTVEVGSPIIVFDIDPNGPEQSSSDNGGGAKIGEESGGRIQSLVGYGPKTGASKRRARKGTTVVEAPPPAPEPEPEPAVVAGGYVPLAKPPVRKLAKDLGVDLRSLATEGQVITRDDVQRAAAPEPVSAPVVTAGERERRVQVRGVRKATAKAMVDSAFTAPHVTEFMTIDVTPMMELRAKLKTHPQFRDVKLTPLVFAAKAVCLAARRTPDINAVWDEAAGEIVYKSYVHLGIAAATPRGLVVPKVHDADAMSLRELAEAIEALTLKARDGKTTPAEMANGTFTITNIGVFGVDTGTPIINPGESAILALGTIRDMPWVVDGQVVPRKICQLSLSFDHRVVDGQQGSEFLADVGALLADPSIAITY
ncbi:dihydrolipoamide acetyltransferase family protein [Actinocrispum sp. NPDC049592]|uniref:dihydrolipoamide acetyltransferase family protein n=1 Tax=Actinocrispum sp. NPDC049592 TaxID=3154835 RepID=UPI003414969E